MAPPLGRCCCCSLRIGVIVGTILMLAHEGYQLGKVIVTMVGLEQQGSGKLVGLMVPSLAVCVIMIISRLILLRSISKNYAKGILQNFIVIIVMVVLAILGFIAIMTSTTIVSKEYEAYFIIAFLVFVCLHIWLAVSVYSLYIEVRDWQRSSSTVVTSPGNVEGGFPPQAGRVGPAPPPPYDYSGSQKNYKY